MGMIGKPRFRIMLKKYDKMNASVQENLVAARVVKSFAREDYEKKKFAASADDLKKAQIYAQKLFSPARMCRLISERVRLSFFPE